jgi:hypothetical protein
MMEILLIVVTLFAVVSCISAYHNGVTDGYGYSREPGCPGYNKAGKYLRKYMAHRWPELGEWYPRCIHGRDCATESCAECAALSLGGRKDGDPLPTEAELQKILDS